MSTPTPEPSTETNAAASAEDTVESTPSPYPALKPEIKFDDFVKLDLRVGTVVHAEEHPNADRLLKLQVDLGFETRQVCAGIKAQYRPEDILGKQIIVVANLAPRKIRGEVSNGMLMAASSLDVAAAVAEGEETPVSDVIVISPSKPATPGSTVG